MRYAECYDAYGNMIDHFTQYDRNQTVYVDIGENDYTSNPMVFFSNSQSTKATEVRGTLDENMVYAEVPNDLLAESIPLLGAVYISDANDTTKQTTIASFEIPVRAQTKPSSYSSNTISCTSIVLDQDTATVKVGETLKLIATVTPYNTTSAISWTSSNTSRATVSNGIVTGVSSSSTAVTITATCGTKAVTCAVTVTS